MMAEHRHLVEQGAKLVELRLDYINGEVNLKRLIHERPGPVVISCRRPRDGGKWSGSEEQRLLLLRTAIAEGVEYVDLEEDIAGLVPRFGKTKRIISFHDFRRTPDDLEAIHRRMGGRDPDIIKLATTANHPDDNFRMFRLVEKSRIPTVGFCMGDIGIPSRILAGRFGSPFTYATFTHERVLAPGQLSFEEMTEVYQYDRIDRQTEIYCVIADPVGHSLSPQIHNAAFHRLKLNKIYVPCRVPKEDLGRFLEEAPSMGVKGLSVTIPHKEAVIEKLTAVDASVRGIGAANTVIFDGAQRRGYNTDCQAAMDSLQAALGVSGEESENMLRGKTALVLGSGGAGKAIACGLVRHGANLVVTDGDPERAKQLAARLKCRSVDWTLRHSIPAEVIVNCTPIGMHPNVDETPYERHRLRPAMVVFDVVYNPENTLLIKEARARNCKVITGVEMFVRQACLQFQLFTGHEGPADLMRDVLKRATAAAKG
jgi:3-dehydroquinate dehydratase/shikimate dehydrogenase